MFLYPLHSVLLALFIQQFSSSSYFLSFILSSFKLLWQQLSSLSSFCSFLNSLSGCNTLHPLKNTFTEHEVWLTPYGTNPQPLAFQSSEKRNIITSCWYVRGRVKGHQQHDPFLPCSSLNPLRPPVCHAGCRRTSRGGPPTSVIQLSTDQFSFKL